MANKYHRQGFVGAGLVRKLLTSKADKAEKEAAPSAAEGSKPGKPRYNPFTKDGKTRPGDKTPTSASQTTGP